MLQLNNVYILYAINAYSNPKLLSRNISMQAHQFLKVSVHVTVSFR